MMHPSTATHRASMIVSQERQLLRCVFTLSVVLCLPRSIVCWLRCTCAVLSVTACVLSSAVFVSADVTSACTVLRAAPLALVDVLAIKAALTGGSPVHVSAGCVVSNNHRCSVCSTLASPSWADVCFKAA